MPLTSCDCADFEQRQVTDSTPCKHQWAAIGATAAMLIGDIRKAESITALQVVGKQYADAMATLHQHRQKRIQETPGRAHKSQP